jgi:hypothetical protein
MARLFRPTIPVAVKYQVVLRQLGEFFIEDVLMAHRFIPRDHRNRSHGRLLSEKLAALAELLKCNISELRLDHDPPLGARQRKGEGKRTVYKPDANDPEYLRYRPHGAQHAGSHDVKTRIRGDHGQYSDVALIKRERRRNKKVKKKRSKLRSAPLRSGNRWPPRGSRKLWRN